MEGNQPLSELASFWNELIDYTERRRYDHRELTNILCYIFYSAHYRGFRRPNTLARLVRGGGTRDVKELKRTWVKRYKTNNIQPPVNTTLVRSI